MAEEQRRVCTIWLWYACDVTRPIICQLIQLRRTVIESSKCMAQREAGGPEVMLITSYHKFIAVEHLDLNVRQYQCITKWKVGNQMIGYMVKMFQMSGQRWMNPILTIFGQFMTDMPYTTRISHAEWEKNVNTSLLLSPSCFPEQLNTLRLGQNMTDGTVKWIFLRK